MPGTCFVSGLWAHNWNWVLFALILILITQFDHKFLHIMTAQLGQFIYDWPLVFSHNMDISMVSCQKGPTCHAYAWQIGPFWQDTLDIFKRFLEYELISYLLNGSRWMQCRTGCSPILLSVKSLNSSAAIELAVIPVCLDAWLETGEMRAGDRQWGSRS